MSTKTQTIQSNNFTKSGRQITYKIRYNDTNAGKGGLKQLGRAGSIFITILAVSVGSAVALFTESDLIETTPNYQVVNDFVPIDDPLNDVDYLQYGTEVVDNIMGFIEGFSAVGDFAYAGVYTVINFFENPVMYVFNLEEDPALDVFNWYVKANRILTTLENSQAWFDSLELGNQLLYEMEIYPDIFILAKWMFYSPIELGV